MPCRLIGHLHQHELKLFALTCVVAQRLTQLTGHAATGVLSTNGAQGDVQDGVRSELVTEITRDKLRVHFVEKIVDRNRVQLIRRIAKVLLLVLKVQITGKNDADDLVARPMPSEKGHAFVEHLLRQWPGAFVEETLAGDAIEHGDRIVRSELFSQQLSTTECIVFIVDQFVVVLLVSHVTLCQQREKRNR